MRLAVGLLLLAFAPVGAQEPAGEPRGEPPGLSLPVIDTTLGNGMRVLALRRPGAPTASFVLQFRVGSVNERLGETGIAHFLEHLLFKGTTTIGTTDLAAEHELFAVMDAVHDTLLQLRARRPALDGDDAAADSAEEARLRRRLVTLEDSARAFVVPNEFDRILTRYGARDMNATTGYEATTYFVRLPSNRAELWFALEADRMANPVLREFYAERDVVAEERRMRVEASPGGALNEELMAAAYRVHPFGVPVIGHMSDIQSYTRAQVRDYHTRFYRPNNAVVAVVGDVDPHRIVEWAERYFGPIPPGSRPAPVLAEEPPQRGERRVTLRFDAGPELALAWRVPDGDHPDAPALSVLASILAGGRTGRLYRRLVGDEPIATGVAASIGPGTAGPLLFTIGAQPLEGHTAEEIEAVIYDEIDRLQEEPPMDREIQRVRNQLEASQVHRLTSNLGLAFQLVESVVYYGDWQETFRAGARLAAVTPEDVQRVAREYFRPENRTVAVLVPLDEGDAR